MFAGEHDWPTSEVELVFLRQTSVRYICEQVTFGFYIMNRQVIPTVSIVISVEY